MIRDSRSNRRLEARFQTDTAASVARRVTRCCSAAPPISPVPSPFQRMPPVASSSAGSAACAGAIFRAPCSRRHQGLRHSSHAPCKGKVMQIAYCFRFALSAYAPRRVLQRGQRRLPGTRGLWSPAKEQS